MAKKIQASFTNNPIEYRPGDRVIQIYPVARPMIGVVVGANKVEGKVYVAWNGRTMQVDPEEIQLATGTPFFPSMRTGSTKSEERQLNRVITALAKTGSPNKTPQFHSKFERNLINAGISPEEADSISHEYEDGFEKRFLSCCLDPVQPTRGEPVVVIDACGSKPGKVGILVGAEGGDCIVDLDTGWSPKSNGCQLLRVPSVAVVPIEGALRERLNSNCCCASVKEIGKKEHSPKVANQAFCLFISSVKNVDVFELKDFKAWVETTSIHDTGEVIVSAVVERGGVCDPLLKLYPIFNQRLAGFNIRNETDYKNAVQRIVPLIDNCKSSILQYFRENIIPGYVEEEVKRSLQASSKVIIHDLNDDSQYEINSPDEAKDKTDKSAAEKAFKSKETVTMGKVVAEYKSASEEETKGPAKTPIALTVFGQKLVDKLWDELHDNEPGKLTKADNAPVGLMAVDQPLIDKVWNDSREKHGLK